MQAKDRSRYTEKGQAKAVSWCTPPELLNFVEAFLGKITLDPCSNGESVVKAKRVFTEKTDGLRSAWGSPGIAYVNPPFGGELNDWVQKVVDEAKNGWDVLMLLPAYTDTKRWQNLIFPNAEAVCFINGRVKYLYQGSMDPSPMASALAWFTHRSPPPVG